jgi:4-azaleucine resistance transporter AzlC
MATNMTPTRGSEFWAGARATIPLVVGATPFAIIFGALAATGGLSAGATIAMSAFVFAGSAQFIAANLVASGTSAGLIILTTLIVNLRHMLYAATLAPHVKHLPQRWLLPLGFWLTDETFVVVVTRYNQPDQSPYKHWYHLGSAVFMYGNWQVWTLVGIFAGQHIADPQSWGLDFALVVTFIGMLVPMVINRPVLAAVLAAGAVAVLANGLPNRLGLIVAALAGVAAGMVAESLQGPAPAVPEIPQTTDPGP